MRKAVLSAVTATHCLRGARIIRADAGPSSRGWRPGGYPSRIARRTWLRMWATRVFFDFDASVIESEGQETLSRQSAWLQKYPQNNVQIASNCDERRTAMQ